MTGITGVTWVFGSLSIGRCRYDGITSVLNDMRLDDFTQFGKAVSESNRVRILTLLVEHGPLCVCELGDVLQLPQSTLSTHLQTLRSTGLVRTDRNHRWIEYAVDPAWEALVRQVVDQLDVKESRELRVDAVRAAARVRLRQDGCCVSGFGSLDRHLQEVLVLNNNNCCPCGCCEGGCQCGDCCGK